MAKGRVSAQQLKRDPLMQQYVATSAWAKGNSRPILKWLTIAVVVAETLEQARYAAGLLQISYEEAPAKVSMRGEEEAAFEPENILVEVTPTGHLL